MCAFVFVVLRRSNPLPIESNRLYICVRVRVCFFLGGGVKNNVIRELKTSIQAFLRTVVKNNDDKEIEDERINNIDISENSLRTLDFTLRQKLSKGWDCNRN